MNLSIVVPTHLVPASVTNIKEWVLNTAAKAVEAGLKPAKTDKSGKNHNIKTYLSTQWRAAFSSCPSGTPLSECIAGLVQAWVTHELIQQSKGSNQSAMPFAPQDKESLRPEQQLLTTRSEEQTAQGKIVFAEAGTGVGKSRVALVLAARHVERTGERAVVAVPTLAVLAQIAREYRDLVPEKTGLDRKPTLKFIIGRGAFVSPTRLQDILEDPDKLSKKENDQEAARKWLEAGGPMVPGSKTEPLHCFKGTEGLRWLAEDLQHVAPGFPVLAVGLSEDDDEECPAAEVYKRLRNEIHSAEIILCTHAMLGLNTFRLAQTRPELERLISQDELDLAKLEKLDKIGGHGWKRITKEKRWAENLLAEIEEEKWKESSSILPDFSFLALDEAHQFEAAIANLKTSDLNPRLLAKKIEEKSDIFASCRQKTAAEKTRDSLYNIHSKLVNTAQFAGREDRVRINGGADVPGYNDKISQTIRPLLQQIKDDGYLAKISKKCEEARHLIAPLSTIIRNVLDDGDGVWINYSPLRRYPSMHTGPRSVSRVLKRIWNRLDSAVLLSATLTIPSSDGMPRAGNLARELAIPEGRLETLSPITQPWLYDAVLIETGKHNKKLTPPSSTEDQAAMAKWAKAIAREILKIDKTAAGGTLALAPSYERIRAIGEHLKGEFGDRLVIQNRTRGVRGAQAQFESLAAEGKKPVWLATGGAGTGVDITQPDMDAANDWWLTDLVIVKIPFGTNRSTTHQARTEYNKIAERDRAALEFKQWIGRLIRRKGLQHRRIHILDPTVWEDRAFFVPFRAILQPYPRERKN